MGGALPAAAQDQALAADATFCGGLSANGQWLGGTESASDLAAANAHLEQMALVLQNNEYVGLFSLSAPAAVRLEAQGRGSGDPAIDLYDEGGAVVLSDDDSGGDGAARAETELQPGRYCLAMRSYDGSPMTGFVRVGRTEHEALTTGADTPAAPPTDPAMPPAEDPDATGLDAACDPATLSTFLGEGEPLDRLLANGPVTATATANEVPFWGFRLETPAALSITAENPDADPSITITDEFGGYLADNDDWDGLNSRIDLSAPLQPGSYCLQVNALADTAQPITVTVAPFDVQAAQIGLYERGEASPPLDGSYPVTALGPVDGRLRQDVRTDDTAAWLSFEVGQPGLIVIEAVTNNLGDPSLVLFDEVGRQIAFNDDNGGSYDALVAARVMPGTYLVGVRQFGDGAQALTRMLLELYVPTQPAP
ncbi:ABC transporter substrate-binding protein [Rubellimicrobium roseum]|uniref:ABC transporter substrate-binding protein n=1 Tax=Rubellimicrobium roseum TaxID=687525 RepID=A0A5C4NCI2_9RHOB|nr:ABC transporter substrate-binding protein [Rubellimicrobium roseum]